MAKELVVVGCVIAMVVSVFSGCATTVSEAEVETGSQGFVLRVNCAAYEPYTDKAGNLWLPD